MDSTQTCASSNFECFNKCEKISLGERHLTVSYLIHKSNVLPVSDDTFEVIKHSSSSLTNPLKANLHLIFESMKILTREALTQQFWKCIQTILYRSFIYTVVSTTQACETVICFFNLYYHLQMKGLLWVVFIFLAQK